MKIKRITNHLTNDLYGFLECEDCGAEEKFVGYNDSYWHDQVLPNRPCKACGKTRRDVEGTDCVVGKAELIRRTAE